MKNLSNYSENKAWKILMKNHSSNLDLVKSEAVEKWDGENVVFFTYFLNHEDSVNDFYNGLIEAKETVKYEVNIKSKKVTKTNL